MSKKTETQKYSPQALALAERVADKVLDGAHLHSEVHEVAGAEWLKIAEIMEKTTCSHITEQRRQSAADAEANFLVGLAIGKRIGGGR